MLTAHTICHYKLKTDLTIHFTVYITDSTYKFGITLILHRMNPLGKMHNVYYILRICIHTCIYSFLTPNLVAIRGKQFRRIHLSKIKMEKLSKIVCVSDKYWVTVLIITTFCVLKLAFEDEFGMLTFKFQYSKSNMDKQCLWLYIYVQFIHFFFMVHHLMSEQVY